MKVNNISASPSFGAIIIKGSPVKRAFIEQNIVPKIIKNPIVEQLDKMGLDIRFREGCGFANYPNSPNRYDTVVELVSQASLKDTKWIADLPDSNRAGAITKKMRVLPKQIRKAAAEMLGGAKDYWDAVLTGTLNA